MTETSALTRLRRTGRVARIWTPQPPDGEQPVVPPRHEMLDLVGPIPFPLRMEETERSFRWYVARPVDARRDGEAPGPEVSVLLSGDLKDGPTRPLVRIHSACFTGDALGSLRCDCGPQLEAAVELIAKAPSGGLLIYMMAHEGRGIGLWAKAAAYVLQDEGMDTYGANRALGYGEDERDFELAAAMVRHFLGMRPFELLTNNPAKVEGLRRFGVTDFVRRSLVEGMSPHNRCYLRAKRAHGHLLPG